MAPRLLALVAVLALGALLLVASIGPAAGSPSARSAGSATVVRFTLSGGLVGRELRLTVRADRRATVVERGQPTRRHTVRPATLRALRGALDAAHLERRSPATPTGCADCFRYTIAYAGHRAAFDDASFPGRMRRAVSALRRIADGGR